METINHECYVSLEVAKLLKKAGFDWKVNHYYFTQNGKTEAKSDFRHSAQNYNESMATMDSKSFEFEVCSRPTLEVTQRWLRENKDFDINVLTDFDSVKRLYYVRYVVKDGHYKTYYITENRSYVYFNTYEEAQEAGNKKGLTLILGE